MFEVGFRISHVDIYSVPTFSIGQGVMLPGTFSFLSPPPFIKESH
jgi:hypothetical protein